jgi:hypothetical protein
MIRTFDIGFPVIVFYDWFSHLQVGVSFQAVFIKIHEPYPFPRLDDSISHLSVHHLLDGASHDFRAVLHGGENLLGRCSPDDLFDVKIGGIVIVTEDVNLVEAAKEIVHVAHDILVGPGEKESDIVVLIRFQIVKKQALPADGPGHETVDLAVRIAGNVDQRTTLVRLLVQSGDGEDRENLIDGGMGKTIPLIAGSQVGMGV